ncbi:MAG: glycosyltransferase [Opitutales bacterium]
MLLAIYILLALALFTYGYNCFVMSYLFLRKQGLAQAMWTRVIADGQAAFDKPDELPSVTTQIPVYNEANVVERVLRAAAAMDYPQGKHEIQVLDDSTDETRSLIDTEIEALQKTGVDVKVVRRANRRGYKAGALRNGLLTCKGDYIAVFDADFIPPPDFLRKLVPILRHDANLAFVQARWGHTNSTKSLLTRAQTIGIDGHFMIEQSARAFNGLFLNFNGTAGLWRKAAILDAGNWQDDTLTEDMDLSYRTQLAGWKAAYAPDVVVPAELPESYEAFKKQQFRWAKGSIQTAIKILPRVFQSPAPVFKKLQAVLHLTHYCIHPLMVALALLALPLILTTEIIPGTGWMIFLALAILTAMIGPSFLYCISRFSLGGSNIAMLRFLPGLICIGVGIALSNSRAVFEAISGVKTPFIRTPKSGDLRKIYLSKADLLPALELLLGSYCAISFAFYLHAGKYLVGPFLLIYALGFLHVGFQGLLERLQPKPA